MTKDEALVVMRKEIGQDSEPGEWLLVDQAPRLERVLAEEGWQATLEAHQEPWGLMSLRRAPAVA